MNTLYTITSFAASFSSKHTERTLAEQGLQAGYQESTIEKAT